MRKFKDYAQQYLVEYQFEKSHSAYVSEKSKVKNLNKFFGKRQIDEITQSNIKSWKLKVHKKFNNKTITDHFTILRAIFLCALGDCVIKVNPMENVKNLKVYTRDH